MDKIKIIGGTPLKGRIPISGAKNAALPLMAACLLSDKPITLKNMPYLADITLLAQLLHQHGVRCHMPTATCTHRDVTLHAEHITSLTAPYELVRKMRASILVLGPLLARFGEAKVSLPGGCAIGTRPVDLHLKALEALGAEITLEDGYVLAKAPKGGLRGGEVHFDIVSVGATENALMAATLAQGKTVITNAAREPEITDLANLLVAMGAKIEGIGRSTLEITGVTSLGTATHPVLPDRIETGTYMAAAAIAGGDVELIGARAEDLSAVIEKMSEAGITITPNDTGIRVQSDGNINGGLNIVTQPHPGFPTDMQAQMMALLALADGASTIQETIFENRFMHVPELQRMGTDITLSGRTATIRGVTSLKGAEVMATDLRASSSLIIAALAAEGESVIHRVYHLDRGYECLEEKLRGVGAQVERIK